MGDPSEEGFRESAGMLVNCRYEPDTIERNHEAYTHTGKVAHAAAVKALLPAVE